MGNILYYNIFFFVMALIAIFRNLIIRFLEEEKILQLRFILVVAMLIFPPWRLTYNWIWDNTDLQYTLYEKILQLCDDDIKRFGEGVLSIQKRENYKDYWENVLKNSKLKLDSDRLEIDKQCKAFNKILEAENSYPLGNSSQYKWLYDAAIKDKPYLYINDIYKAELNKRAIYIGHHFFLFESPDPATKLTYNGMFSNSHREIIAEDNPISEVLSIVSRMMYRNYYSEKSKNSEQYHAFIFSYEINYSRLLLQLLILAMLFGVILFNKKEYDADRATRIRKQLAAEQKNKNTNEAEEDDELD